VQRHVGRDPSEEVDVEFGVGEALLVPVQRAKGTVHSTLGHRAQHVVGLKCPLHSFESGRLSEQSYVELFVEGDDANAFGS